MFTLYDKWTDSVRIVISPDAAAVEKHAAEELQRYLCEITGELPSLVEKDHGSGPVIVIGSGAAIESDGYQIRIDERAVYLTGARPYSCLYAVYHFLEKYLGCGFFEDGDQIPKQESVILQPMDERYTPRFAVRIFEGSMPMYSGVIWWTWEEFKPWIDWLVKKRFNVLYSNRLLYCGISALAAGKMGVDIPLTDFQKQRLPLLRRVFDYARSLGMRVLHTIDMHIADTRGVPGASPHPDGKQLLEFIDRFRNSGGKRIKTYTTSWCGLTNTMIDTREPEGRDFISAVVEVISEQLGEDHFYQMWLPTEESVAGMDPENANDVTYAQVFNTIDAIRAGDPEAEIWSPRVCADNPTGAAQARAVRDAGLPVHGNYFLHLPGRLYDFLQCDYYWDLPWSTGMCGQCGRETNPNGDIKTAIQNAREVANNPKASKCIGFHVSTETIHRNIMTMDLYCELAWNPNDVDPNEYIRRWCERRYGPALVRKLLPAVQLFAGTLMAKHDMGMHNGPFYRNWDGTQLPGLTSSSVKRLIGTLPDLQQILELLVAEQGSLGGSPLYRFDLVDISRTYMAAIFNDKLARTRLALRRKDKAGVDEFAEQTLEAIRFMARLCSADPQFRLKTYDDNSKRWPQIIPGHENSESTWITFTALLSIDHWQVLLDYMVDDYAEIIEHYYTPRVELYLSKMKDLAAEGKDISGRLVDRGTDTDLPSRVADWATPHGFVPWSPYGDTCEPELTEGDEALAYELIRGGSVGGKYEFFEGPIGPLVSQMLERFPPPDDIKQIVSELDPAQKANRMILKGNPGDKTFGFTSPGFVERATVPKALENFVAIEKKRSEYNISRGEVSLLTVSVYEHIVLERLEDRASRLGGNAVAVFGFSVMGTDYELAYDPGSDATVAEVRIEQAGE